MLVLALLAPAAAEERELAVAAASDLKYAMDELAAAFERRRPGIRVKLSYGSSGNFFAQLSQKAPFDVFFSADVDYAQRLEAAGQAPPGSVFVYAVGRIVVWVPRASPLDLEKDGMRALLSPGVRRIAIANPRHAPYGRAAEAALRHAGVYEGVRGKLVLGENVAQAAQFAESGNADAGIIAHAIALHPAMRQEGRFWEVPLDAYARLEQGGLILGWARDPESARAFRGHVLGEDGRAILKRWGFLLPGE